MSRLSIRSLASDERLRVSRVSAKPLFTSHLAKRQNRCHERIQEIRTTMAFCFTRERFPRDVLDFREAENSNVGSFGDCIGSDRFTCS